MARGKQLSNFFLKKEKTYSDLTAELGSLEEERI